MINLSRGAALLLLASVSFSVQSANPADAEKIDINAASLEDLVKIIHIGKIRAEKLIFLRPFSSLDDLIRIKGIGEARLEDIKNQGLAWILEESQAEQIPFLATEEDIEQSPPEEKGLAAISRPLQERQEKKTVKSPSLFIIALLVAIFSGIIILFLKKQLKINYNKNL